MPSHAGVKEFSNSTVHLFRDDLSLYVNLLKPTLERKSLLEIEGIIRLHGVLWGSTCRNPESSPLLRGRSRFGRSG